MTKKAVIQQGGGTPHLLKLDGCRDWPVMAELSLMPIGSRCRLGDMYPGALELLSHGGTVIKTVT